MCSKMCHDCDRNSDANNLSDCALLCFSAICGQMKSSVLNNKLSGIRPLFRNVIVTGLKSSVNVCILLKNASCLIFNFHKPPTTCILTLVHLKQDLKCLFGTVSVITV